MLADGEVRISTAIEWVVDSTIVYALGSCISIWSPNILRHHDVRTFQSSFFIEKSANHLHET